MAMLDTNIILRYLLKLEDLKVGMFVVFCSFDLLEIVSLFGKYEIILVERK